MSSNAAEKLKSYPALTEMGIVRVHEISHYSLRQDGPESDVLRVNYKRAKGSLLPYSRKYKFGRSLKTIVADGGSGKMEHNYEISPFLLKAVTELDYLVAENKLEVTKAGSQADLKADLLTEINELDELVRSKQADKDLAEAIAKIDLLRKHIQSL